MNITLQIDLKTIKVEKGSSVLDAARRADIYIPTLCHHPLLNPEGSCRLCVVEIEDMRGYPTACTTPAENDMVVRTNTPQLLSLRRHILELTLSEHPYTCLVCDKREGCDDWMGTIRKVGITTSCQTCPKSGFCELQDLVRYLGIKEITFPITYRSYPVKQEDPFFDRDYNLCIHCGRCVRVCNEVRYNGTLNFQYRGDQTVVGTAFGKSHLEVGCEFCGACVDVCPTGALFGKEDKWKGCSERSQYSICPYCSVGCSLDFHLQGNRIIRSSPSQKKTLNEGQICVRGRFSVVDVVHHAERIQKPMVKREGKWIETSWEEAIDWAAKRFIQYKGDSFGLVVSPYNTIEDAYVLQKFGRVVMQSNQIAVSSPFAQNRFVKPFAKLRQFERFNASMDDIDRADVIVVWGGDLSVSHPIIVLKVKQAVHQGAKLAVVDPRKTKLAKLSDIHVRLNPGQYLFLTVGLLKLMLNNHIIKPTAGLSRSEWDDFKNKLDRINLSYVEKKTGIPRKQMEELVHLFLHHESVLFLFGSDLALQESAQDSIFALVNLAMSVDHAKIIPVVGEANLMGSLEMGCCSSFLPGLFPIETSPIKRRFENAWNVSLPKESQFDTADMIDLIGEGKIKALYITGEMPKLEVLKKCECIVVQSVFRPDWAEWADVLLPAAHTLEIDGTVMNFEHRMQHLHQVQKPTGYAKPDWWICSHIAQKMGASCFSYKKSSTILSEITSVVPGYEDLAHSRIGKSGLLLSKLKCNSEKMNRPFFHFHLQDLDNRKTQAYPYTLMMDIGLFHYRNGSLIEKVHGMEHIVSEKKIEIHPNDAERLDVSTGDCVQIKSKGGFVYQGHVIVTDRVPQKSVYVLFDKNVPQSLWCLRGNTCSVKIKKVVHE